MTPSVLYFDTCALNRLTDDQSQTRISIEADAITGVLQLVEDGEVKWLASETLRMELTAIPDEAQRAQMLELLHRSSGVLQITPAVLAQAESLKEEGFGNFDSLHLAHCYVAAVDCLLTVDDRLIRRYARRMVPDRLRVLNPVDWIERSVYARK